MKGPPRTSVGCALLFSIVAGGCLGHGDGEVANRLLRG